MHINRIHDDESVRGPADNFTGQARIDNLGQATEPGRVSALTVTFEPGARTAWHSHPYGQLLIITTGEGWIQAEGGEKHTVRAGDTVVTEPGEKHWHGATDTKAMSHIAIQEAENGSPITWMEHVDDDIYLD